MAEPNLQKGSTDPAVRDLQEALKALGYNPGPIDSVFGAATEIAVKAFQQARGITVDGIVGKVTWINIDEADQSEPVLKLGSTGLPVRRAQKRMSLVGYDVGGVDGRYGTRTEAAVKKLQQQRGLSWLALMYCRILSKRRGKRTSVQRDASVSCPLTDPWQFDILIRDPG
jgi:peptidoglycan hydrolase-like protein with peptidoglycan-binding domain